ncbi:sterile alpha motif domain-containing protein 3 isoform X2 [Mus musculus]|uniref:sterile alpha motif domain-containing protein 3 isoform X2 n=1 Tax=Mus musculus TaxID=10090 RepID=UPI0003D7867A|nr:sterile alpha motif domain-containing protein 3 isoform X2 [Mus musculus]|eukprot:XP_006512806.1 PREDICTED: sterile alpha motif domain-containing protein 3 isoform X3 [Mus musculus]
MCRLSAIEADGCLRKSSRRRCIDKNPAMETWSVDQVCKWLVEKNLGELVPRFQEEEVSGATLLALNDRMVQQLVKKIGHQAVLMDFIKKYKQGNQELKPTGGPADTSTLTPAQAAPEHEQNPSPTSHGDQTSLYPAVLDNRLIDQRVLKQRRNVKHVLARHKALQWTKSYILPEFPYDVKCMLVEQKRPDHSMRIRIIEFLQADMTKYLEGSLYPTTQQYNDVVNALLQAHPFLDEDGCGFEESAHLDSEVDEHISWFQQEYMKTERDWREVDKRMSQTLEIRRKMIGGQTPLKDILKMFPFLKCPYQMFREVQILTKTDIYKKTRHILESYSENILTAFSVLDNPINTALQEKMKHYTDEGVLKYMKMTATCLLLPHVFGDEPSLFVVVNGKVHVSTPVLEVKNPFHINGCEFSLYLNKEKLTKVDDCVTALAALVSAFRVFGIECPRRLSQTFNFLETLIFDMQSPQFPSLKEKEIRSQPPIT